MATTKIQKLPAREEVDPADTWDLSSLFASDKAWEAAFRKWERRIPGFQRFRGQLGNDPAALAACLKFADCHGFWGPPIDGDKMRKIGHNLLPVIKQGGGPWPKDRQPNRPDLFVAFVCR